MKNFYYVYILIDVATETHHYVGSTQDLQARLAKHNAGEVPHTSKFRPWRIQTAIAFDSKEKAIAFEAYSKPVPADHSLIGTSDLQQKHLSQLISVCDELFFCGEQFKALKKTSALSFCVRRFPIRFFASFAPADLIN